MKAKESKFEELLGKARKDIETGDKLPISEQQYNFDYQLSPDQIHAFAIMEIAKIYNIDQNKALDDFYIQEIETPADINYNNQTLIDFGYTEIISTAIENIKANKTPSFLTLSDGKHHVLLSLVPDKDNSNKISILYSNSMPSDYPGYKTNNMVNVCRNFAKSVTEYLNLKRASFEIELASDNYTDISVEQQLGECCGLSVISNISNIAKHHKNEKDLSNIKSSLFTPKSNNEEEKVEEKRKYYQDLGSNLFNKIKDENIIKSPIEKSEKSKIFYENLIKQIDLKHSYKQVTEIYNKQIKIFQETNKVRSYKLNQQQKNKDGTKTTIWDHPDHPNDKNYQITYITDNQNRIIKIESGNNANAIVPPVCKLNSQGSELGYDLSIIENGKLQNLKDNFSNIRESINENEQVQTNEESNDELEIIQDSSETSTELYKKSADNSYRTSATESKDIDKKEFEKDNIDELLLKLKKIKEISSKSFKTKLQKLSFFQWLEGANNIESKNSFIQFNEGLLSIFGIMPSDTGIKYKSAFEKIDSDQTEMQQLLTGDNGHYLVSYLTMYIEDIEKSVAGFEKFCNEALLDAKRRNEYESKANTRLKLVIDTDNGLPIADSKSEKRTIFLENIISIIDQKSKKSLHERKEKLEDIKPERYLVSAYSFDRNHVMTFINQVLNKLPTKYFGYPDKDYSLQSRFANFFVEFITPQLEGSSNTITPDIFASMIRPELDFIINRDGHSRNILEAKTDNQSSEDNLSLTSREVLALKLLTNENGKDLKPEQLQFIKEFIKNSIIDEDFREKLNNINSKQMILPKGISNNIVNDLNNFISVINSSSLDKLRKDWNRIKNNIGLDENYKFDVTEYNSLIISVDKAKEFVKIINFDGFLNNIYKKLKDVEEISIISQEKQESNLKKEQITAIKEIKIANIDDLKNFKLNEENKDQYIGMWKSYLNDIMSKGNLHRLQSTEATTEQIPYMQQYVAALDMLNVKSRDEYFQAKMKDFLQIASHKNVKDKMENLDKKEVDVLNGKKGKKTLQSGLTAKETRALEWMSDAKNGKELNPTKLKFVQEFIEFSIGNMNLNKRLKHIIENGAPAGVNNRMINGLYSFTFKSKNLSKLDSIMEKMKKNLNRIENNMDLDENHKLTLKEYGMISDISKSKIFLDSASSYGLLKNNDKLNNLYIKLDEIEKTLDSINKKIQNENNLESDDLLFHNTKKIDVIKIRNLSFMNKIASLLVSSHEHVGKIVSKKDRELSVSHMYPKPKNDILDFSSYLYSNIYKLRIEKLISTKSHQQLIKKYGDEWFIKINEIYRDIESKIHINSEDNYSEVILAGDRHFIAVGLADIIPGGHRRSKDRDFNKIYDKVMNGHYSENETKMICSEFSAKTTIAALIELDNQLKKELGITDKDQHVIDMPFDKREKLSKIHPDRLIKILKEKGCLEKLEPTETQKKIFKSSEFEDSEKGKILKKAKKLGALIMDGKDTRTDNFPPPQKIKKTNKTNKTK